MNKSLPKCPACNGDERIEPSESPEIGSHFCIECDVFFTQPVQYQTLSPRFLSLMDEIGQYGLSKYGERSTASRFAKGDYSRDERTKSRSFAEHANVHFNEYIDGIKHDKFNTREHQLAAAAFNAMLEYQFYKETL